MRQPPDKRSGPDTTPDRSHKNSTTAGEAESTVTDAAWRCWSWRAVHCCGCGRPGDCLVLVPPPGPWCCPGEFGPDGRFRQHCGLVTA
jgi:hypothetical protein